MFIFLFILLSLLLFFFFTHINKHTYTHTYVHTYIYTHTHIQQYLKYLPKDIQEIIEKDGAAAALDFTYELTKPYISQHYIDEMQGLADGGMYTYILTNF